MKISCPNYHVSHTVWNNVMMHCICVKNVELHETCTAIYHKFHPVFYTSFLFA